MGTAYFTFCGCQVPVCYDRGPPYHSELSSSRQTQGAVVALVANETSVVVCVDQLQLIYIERSAWVDAM